MRRDMSIKKNEDGTYEVTFGIAEGVNRNGLFFRREVVERELERFNNNPQPLISELGYPVRTDPPDSFWVASARVQDFHLDRACGYISDLKIVEGSPSMIVGTFTPAGIHENEAIKLIDQKEPVRFGMRALGFHRGHEGQEVLEVHHIITWDLISGESA
jgi:hypothetical protein